MSFKKQQDKISVELKNDLLTFNLDGLKVTYRVEPNLTDSQLLEECNKFLNINGYKSFDKEPEPLKETKVETAKSFLGFNSPKIPS